MWLPKNEKCDGEELSSLQRINLFVYPSWDRRQGEAIK